MALPKLLRVHLKVAEFAQFTALSDECGLFRAP